VLPFKVANALTLFMDYTNIICLFPNKFVVVFIDDILIYSSTHEKHLKTMSSITIEKQLYIKLSRCEF